MDSLNISKTAWLYILLLATVLLPGLARAETHTVTYYIPDAQGSPIVAIDRDSGTVKWRKHYRPFGQEIEQGAASQDNRIGYTGHVHDRASGLTYMGHRYYDPYRGQFNSMDPAAVDPNDPRTFNRFAYGYNAPYNYVDPNGRSPDDVAVWTAAFIEPSPFGEVGAAIYTVGKYTLIGLGVWGGAEGIIQLNENGHDSADDIPNLPGGLVGVQDDKSGERGNRHNSGPLAPDHGGTGDAQDDFDYLTGGTGKQAPENYPEGTLIGDNGITIRPAKNGKGARIDIPSNGNKPHETLHY